MARVINNEVTFSDFIFSPALCDEDIIGPFSGVSKYHLASKDRK